MNETAINWTELTWNPASGCTKVSEGCRYCYAETIAENKRGTRAFPVGFDVMMRPWKLDEPAKVRRPSLIFTNSMTDMFHPLITDAYRDAICEAMERAPQHRYQVLTKRPEFAAKYLETRRLPRTVWLGVTVEHQKTVGRLDILRQLDATVRFVSAEPLLGALDLDLRSVDWLISGGESGSHMNRDDVRDARGLVRRGGVGEPRWVPREDRAAWVRSLRDQCLRAGVAYWHKQWGGPRPESAGRSLDGRTWDQMPHAIPGAMPGPTPSKQIAL